MRPKEKVWTGDLEGCKKIFFYTVQRDPRKGEVYRIGEVRPGVQSVEKKGNHCNFFLVRRQKRWTTTSGQQGRLKGSPLQAVSLLKEANQKLERVRPAHRVVRVTPVYTGPAHGLLSRGVRTLPRAVGPCEEKQLIYLLVSLRSCRPSFAPFLLVSVAVPATDPHGPRYDTLVSTVTMVIGRPGHRDHPETRFYSVHNYIKQDH